MCVLLMANSFGYFANADDDQRILSEIARVLRPGGRFLLDVTDYEHVRQHFCAESWHEATADIVVCWQREWREDVIRVREMVLSKSSGLLRDRGYAERLYPPEQLRELLQRAGLHQFQVHPDAFIHDPDDNTDYGLATHRHDHYRYQIQKLGLTYVTSLTIKPSYSSTPARRPHWQVDSLRGISPA